MHELLQKRIYDLKGKPLKQLMFDSKKELYLFLITEYNIPKEVFIWDNNESLIENEYFNWGFSYNSTILKLPNKSYDNSIINAFKIEIKTSDWSKDKRNFSEIINSLKYQLNLYLTKEDFKSFYSDFYKYKEYNNSSIQSAIIFTPFSFLFPSSILQLHILSSCIISSLNSFLSSKKFDYINYKSKIFYVINFYELEKFFVSLIKETKEYDNEINIYEDFIMSLKKTKINNFYIEL